MSEVSSACKTMIKYSLFQSLPYLSFFEENCAPSNKLSCCYCYAKLYPTHARPCCPTPLILSLLALILDSSPLGRTCSPHLVEVPIFCFSNFLAVLRSYDVLPCRLIGCVCLPASLSRRIRRPWVTCSSFTPVVLHAYNKPYRSRCAEMMFKLRFTVSLMSPVAAWLYRYWYCQCCTSG